MNRELERFAGTLPPSPANFYSTTLVAARGIEDDLTEGLSSRTFDRRSDQRHYHSTTLVTAG